MLIVALPLVPLVNVAAIEVSAVSARVSNE
jgi:hypothetical protein